VNSNISEHLSFCQSTKTGTNENKRNERFLFVCGWKVNVTVTHDDISIESKMASRKSFIIDNQ
jgi:hypothetical protein